MFVDHMVKLKRYYGSEIQVTFLVPEWPSATWYKKCLQHFNLVARYEKGENLFTAPHPYIKGKRRNCGTTKWPVLIFSTKEVNSSI